MQQPPNPYPQYPQQWQQLPPFLLPQYQQHPQYQPWMPPPKKKSHILLWIILAAVVLVLVVISSMIQFIWVFILTMFIFSPIWLVGVFLLVLSIYKLCKPTEHQSVTYQYPGYYPTFSSPGYYPIYYPTHSRYIRQKTKLKVVDRDGLFCQHCGSDENLEFGHIIPYSMGGESDTANIQILCRSCNRSKGNRYSY